MTRPPKMTAQDMRRALLMHFQQRWAMLPEVTAATHAGQRIERRIDMLLVRRMPRRMSVIERLAVEIKVTRADFLSDVRNPEKQAPWRALAHRHAYAVPAGLVTPEEVPADSGLIVVGPIAQYGMTRVDFARRCPVGNDPGPLPTVTVMDAFHRATRGEALRCGYGFQAPGEADPDELRAQILRLKHELQLAQGQIYKARERVNEWRRRFARHELPACGTCGHQIHPPAKERAFMSGRWEHRDPEQAAACFELRVQVQLTADAARGYTYEGHEEYVRQGIGVPGPEPEDETQDTPEAPQDVSDPILTFHQVVTTA